MNTQVLVRNFFLALGTPYAKMKPWKRNLTQQVFAMVEGIFDVLTYLPFVLLPYLFLRNEWNLQLTAVALWCICEVVFHIYCYTRVYEFIKIKEMTPKLDSSKRLELASTMCEHMMDPESDLGGWLIERPSDKLHIGDISKWLIWTFFGKEPDKLTTKEWDEAAVILQIYKKRLRNNQKWGMTWKGKTDCMRPTLDDLNHTFRPLFFVAILAIHKLILNVAWYIDGYKWRSLSPGVSYWVHEPVGKEDGLPILFLHGIGVGIYMYPTQIGHLARQYPNRRILVLYVPSASNTPYAHIPSQGEILCSIEKMLKETNTSKVSILAHSFGTILTGWLAKHNPCCIEKITMVDPVAFEVWDSTLTYKSMYSEPISIFHHLLCLVAKDPVTRAYLQSFWLPQYILFPETLTVPTEIFIAENDWIVNGPKNYKYLMDRKAKSKLDNFTLHLVDMTHGEYLLSYEHFNRFNANI